MERVAGGSATDNFSAARRCAGRGPPTLDPPRLRHRLRALRRRQPRAVAAALAGRSVAGRTAHFGEQHRRRGGRHHAAGFRTYLGADAEVSPLIDIWFVNVVGRTDRSRGAAIARLRPGVSLAAAQQAVNQLVPAPVHLTLVPLAGRCRARRPAGAAGLQRRRRVRAARGLRQPDKSAARPRLCPDARARDPHRDRRIAAAADPSARDRERGARGDRRSGGPAGRAVGGRRPGDARARRVPRRETIEIGGQVALFAFAVAMASSLVFGLVPAWQATRAELSAMIKHDAAAARGSVTRGLLVASQLAFSMLLLVGAGLMARTFISMRQLNLGFDPSHVLTMRLELSFRRFDTPAKRAAFYQQARDAVRDSRCSPGRARRSGAARQPADVSAARGRGRRAGDRRVDARGVLRLLRHDAHPHARRPRLRTGRRRSGKSSAARHRRAASGRSALAWCEPDRTARPAPVGPLIGDMGRSDWRRRSRADRRSAAERVAANLRIAAGLRGYFPAFIIRTDGDPRAIAGPVKAAIERLGPGGRSSPFARSTRWSPMPRRTAGSRCSCSARSRCWRSS